MNKIKTILSCLVFFLSGCAAQGELRKSVGSIQHWERNGDINLSEGVEILALPENVKYQKIDTVLLGVSIFDMRPEFKNVIGRKPFKIILKLRSEDSGVYFRQYAKLYLSGKEYEPTSVFQGLNILNSKRYSNQITQEDFNEYMRIDSTIKFPDAFLLEFVFDVETPSPEQVFILELQMKKNEKIELLKIKFKPEDESIYWS